MSEWWRGLEDRERILLAVAGVLTALVVVLQFILMPVFEQQRSMQAELDRAADQLNHIERAYLQGRALGAVTATATREMISEDAFKAAITQSASEKGLSITRLQSGATTVGVMIEQADPRLVFFWLEDLERRIGAAIVSLSVEQASGERVRVNVELSRGAGS